MKTKVSQTFNKEDDPSSVLHDDSIRSDDRVGVEIEVEGLKESIRTNLYKSQPFRYWKCVEDGSLRDGGLEFVFKKAFGGKDIINALSEIDAMVMSKYPLALTERTSIHVHVDVRDLDIDELIKYILLYILCENILFKFCGEERQESIFCIPVNKSDKLATDISTIIHYIRIGRIDILPDHISNFGRYSSINLVSLVKYGSLEFRGHQGTSDVGRIKNWINLLLNLKVKSRSLSISWETLPDEVLAKGVMTFMQDLFEDLLPTITYDGIVADINRNLKLVQEIINFSIWDKGIAIDLKEIKHPLLKEKYSKLTKKLKKPTKKTGLTEHEMALEKARAIFAGFSTPSTTDTLTWTVGFDSQTTGSTRGE